MQPTESCPAGDPAECPINRRGDDPRWERMAGRMDEFERALRANTDLTMQVKKNTDDIIVLFGYGRGFLRTLAMFGGVAKWIAKIGAALLILWAVFRYGVAEALKDISGGSGKP